MVIVFTCIAKDKLTSGRRGGDEVKRQKVTSDPSVVRSQARGAPQGRGVVRARPVGAGKGGRGTAAASAFYGAAAARILGKDGGSKQSRPAG